ncbi:hypothetical protein [Paraburkholderia strydomiana]
MSDKEQREAAGRNRYCRQLETTAVFTAFKAAINLEPFWQATML